MDPHTEIKSCTLQISGICSRVQTKQYSLEAAMTNFHQVSYQIEQAADKMKKKHELEMDKMKDELRRMRKLNCKLRKDNFALEQEIKLAKVHNSSTITTRSSPNSLFDDDADDNELISICESQEKELCSAQPSKDDEFGTSLLTSTPKESEKNLFDLPLTPVKGGESSQN